MSTASGKTPPPAGTADDETSRLRRAVEELSILNDLARAIGGLVNSQEVMHTIIHRSVRAIQAEQGVITMVDRNEGDAMKTLVRTIVKSAGQEHYHFNQSLLGWMHLHRTPLLMNTPREDPRFRGVRWDESIQSLLCVPLMVKGQVRGVLTVYNKKGTGGFTEDDQRLLAIIAGQSAQVIENARLYEAEQDLLRMKEEIRLAGRIQADLLPHTLPAIPGYAVAGRAQPAQDVGGDYYDVIPMEGHRIGLCLGDVSGKGLPASLLMANVQATLRSQSLVDAPPRLCIQRANTLLLQSTSPEKFVTLFYGVLDFEHHTLTYVNAGHEYPYLFSGSDDPQRLSTGGAPLSIIDRFPFEEQVVPVSPGDVLVVFSDGVSEAMNADGEQFGQERLAALIAECRGCTPEAIIQRIIGGVQHHRGAAPQNDDITLVVLNRLPA